jgi:hypothetical protein
LGSPSKIREIEQKLLYLPFLFPTIFPTFFPVFAVWGVCFLATKNISWGGESRAEEKNELTRQRASMSVIKQNNPGGILKGQREGRAAARCC